MKKHGYAPKYQKRSSEYYTWLNIRDRCNNPNNNAYKHYGGRGISISKEWDDFLVFLNDMGKRPKGRKISIDRIDPNGNYCKENCRWTDPVTQANNRRNTKKYVINEKEYTIRDIMDETGLCYSTIQERIDLYLNSSPERIIEPHSTNKVFITFENETLTIVEWAKKLNVKYYTLHKSLYRKKYDPYKSKHFMKYLLLKEDK